MIVHQAIYGDKSGSYALLKTSLADTELAKRICNVTDLLDRPSIDYLTKPVIRGFAFKDFYIFIKSFPYNDTSVRTGRVLSHTLIVDKSDLHKLNNLNDLFSHFLSEPDKTPELNPIIFEDKDSVPPQITNYTSREAAGINGLLYHSDYNNTLVWIGEEGYLSFITQVWSQLEAILRAKLKLGVGFNPQKIDAQNLNILYVMEDYENKWKASDFCIVGKEDTGILESMSSFLLAGHEDKSKPLKDLIKTFGIAPTEIEDFRYLETGVTLYKNLSTTADFNRLVVLCDLISRYSPDPKVAKTEKNELLTQVISRIELASAKQIFTLKNPEWKGFLNGQQLIGDHITNWVVKSLFNFEADKSMTNVISAFDPDNEVQWWKKAFLDGLKTTLEKWKSTYGIVVWNWFTGEHDLVKTLGTLIPATTQVEKDLVSHWPKPEHELAQNIQVFAKDRKWLTLHGLSTLQLHSPEESIKRQLRIDTDPEHFDALNKMGELIHDKEFIQLTRKVGESRLVQIAGSKVARTPSLLGQLDVKNIVWRQIWLRAIEYGNKPWDGIKKPIEVFFALFEEILNGEQIEPELLLNLSNSNYNDLSGFARRTEVWQYLSGSSKSGFLDATTLGCLKLIEKKDIQINNLEKEIRNRLVDSVIIKRVVEDQTIGALTKIQLFEELPGLGENELLILLNAGHFSSGESKRLGKLILRKRWKRATVEIARNIARRKDLKPALAECKSLLSFFDRLRQPVNEGARVFISYSHKDDEYRKQLKSHIRALERIGLITNWHDRMITAGSEWEGKIDENLNQADVILLLISDSFIDSRYCFDVELKRALQRHEDGESLVIPIIIRPVIWSDLYFAKLQVLPTDGKAVSTWSNIDLAWVNVAEGLKTAVQDFLARKNPNKSLDSDARAPF